MLKHITIHLLHPLCGCSGGRMLWSIIAESEQVSFLIWCSKCNTILKVPIENISAYFQTDIQFKAPGQNAQDKNKLN